APPSPLRRNARFTRPGGPHLSFPRPGRTAQMMIVMKPNATPEEIEHVVARISSVGARAHISRGDEVTLIGAIGDREHVARLELEGAPGVAQVVPILKPYKLSSAQLRGGEQSVFEIAGRRIGGEHFALIAEPCTVEARAQLLD